ncbi:metal-sensing transcriptional repressor [Lachnospira multipara]|uniref:metal-sensing transcriptional repressor n=1 Tax=Lachnospira multipara TaxID=28051 RepID=UPI0003FE9573|nr:metal-sensing transcriptional repressor [Lachnospira multipara]
MPDNADKINKEADKLVEISADEVCCHCGNRTKERSDKEYKDLINRLSRIEGQIRGVKKMIESDAYCIDVLNQVSAASSALNSFSKLLLANHIKSCVINDIKEGKDESVDELVRTIQKFIK